MRNTSLVGRMDVGSGRPFRGSPIDRSCTGIAVPEGVVLLGSSNDQERVVFHSSFFIGSKLQMRCYTARLCENSGIPPTAVTAVGGWFRFGLHRWASEVTNPTHGSY